MNRPTRELRAMIAEEFPDYHPVIALAKMAHDETNDASLRAQCHKEVAKYSQPVPKPVDQEGQTDAVQTIRIISELPDGIGPSKA